MSRFSRLIWLAVAVIAAVALLIPAVPGPAEPKEKEPPPPALYHADRDHLWNRVHAALFVRTGPDGKAYGEDRLEPLLWNESGYLLDGPRADRAVAVLDEFDRVKGETLVADPVKRAVLQRDLWLVFNWLTQGKEKPVSDRLGTALARVIRRLALTPEQIARLPDNHAAAVASKGFADRFDPEKPDAAYLPDLFRPDGPWVCVGRSDGPTAPQHLREDGTSRFTNSAFLVFLKLPDGRDATVDLLKRLVAFDKPLLLPNPDEKSRRAYPFLPNPAVPQFPRGAEVALVRRALLVATSREVVASPLTESVQLRVLRTETPAPTLAVVSLDGARRAADWQAYAEFQVRRADLFAGQAGGLRDASAERDFKTGFGSHPQDEFENPMRSDGPFPQRSQPFENNRASCVVCHALPGVYGFNSLADFSRGFGGRVDGDKLRPFPLAARTVAEVEKAAIQWKESRPSWTALRKLLPE